MAERHLVHEGLVLLYGLWVGYVWGHMRERLAIERTSLLLLVVLVGPPRWKLPAKRS